MAKTTFADHEWQREKLGHVQAAAPRRTGPRRVGLLGEIEPKKLGKIAKRFLYPPFSVLNAREGIWQSRKALWLSLGIQSELGRFDNSLQHSDQSQNINFYALKRELETELGRTLSTDDARAELFERGKITVIEGPRSDRRVKHKRDGIGHTFSISVDGVQHQKRTFQISTGGRATDGTENDLPRYDAEQRLKKISPGGSPRPATDYSKSGARGDGTGRAIKVSGAVRLGANGGGLSNQMAAGEGTKRKKAFGTTDEQTRYRAADKRAKRLQAAPGGTGAGTCWMGAPNMGEDYAEPGDAPQSSGTSIFDPVLTELSYKWFCPPRGKILDPFAGGSVRGVVAGYLGYRYRGIELRPEQSVANRRQAADILGDDAGRCEWIDGDSTEINDYVRNDWADFVFSCPPYGDLEVYSDDPRDLSQMDYPEFLAAYRKIIRRTARCLKPNRFAAFVVGDYRLKNGCYANFTAETIAAFAAAGMPLYNSAVLITAVGSLPIRIAKQFATGRKLGRTHQDVLVFVKGDWKRAAKKCGGEIQ